MHLYGDVQLLDISHVTPKTFGKKNNHKLLKMKIEIETEIENKLGTEKRISSQIRCLDVCIRENLC